MKKDILTLLDLDKEDYEHFFKRSIELKNRYKKGISDFPLKGKTQALIFDKPSTRTRISFETAMSQLRNVPIGSGPDSPVCTCSPRHFAVRIKAVVWQSRV